MRAAGAWPTGSSPGCASTAENPGTFSAILHLSARQQPAFGGRIMVGTRVGAALAALLLGTGIAAAQTAKPSDPQIGAFAQDMVRDHTAVNQQALALVKKLNVTPQDNPTSQSLVKQADEERAKLAKLNGAAFDRAYVENEVNYHHTVNNALATTLIPDAQNAELKSLLETGLKIFQGHEQHARQVAAALK